MAADVPPAMKLTVAVVRCAAVDAGAGDDEARDWLDSDGLALLGWLLPEHVDAATVLSRLAA